jgi:hypothetical protein
MKVTARSAGARQRVSHYIVSAQIWIFRIHALRTVSGEGDSASVSTSSVATLKDAYTDADLFERKSNRVNNVFVGSAQRLCNIIGTCSFV